MLSGQPRRQPLWTRHGLGTHAGYLWPKSVPTIHGAGLKQRQAVTTSISEMANRTLAGRCSSETEVCSVVVRLPNGPGERWGCPARCGLASSYTASGLLANAPAQPRQVHESLCNHRGAVEGNFCCCEGPESQGCVHPLLCLGCRIPRSSWSLPTFPGEVS